MVEGGGGRGWEVGGGERIAVQCDVKNICGFMHERGKNKFLPLINAVFFRLFHTAEHTAPLPPPSSPQPKRPPDEMFNQLCMT